MESKTLVVDDGNVCNQLDKVSLNVCENCFIRFVVNPRDLMQKSSNFLAEIKRYVECLNDSSRTICSICLGLLQAHVLEEIGEKVIGEISSMPFDCTSYQLALMAPMTHQIRERSFALYLKKDFPTMFPPNAEIPYENIKDAWRVLLSTQILKATGKKLDNKSELLLTIQLSYEEEMEDCNRLTDLSNGQSQKHRVLIKTTGSDVSNILKMTSDERFAKVFPVPPPSPVHAVQFVGMTFLRDSIFCAGRYNKWSRTLPQTPWLIDGKRKHSNSVQELITDCLEPCFLPDSCRFSSSGREDVDARMLGKGRPFVVEFVNPKISSISPEDMRKVERDINNNAYGLIHIRDLQIVKRLELKFLKEGEETKKKEYCELCVAYGTIPMQKLGACTEDVQLPLLLDQWTPIRVLHRRSNAVRQRYLYDIKMEFVKYTSDGHTIFKLYLTTQAGTYVKEYVHGDFGRTTPDVSSILGVKCDVLALDVTEIHLDWPPALKY